MPKSRHQGKKFTQSHLNQKRHLKECAERDAVQLARATELKADIARAKDGRIPWSVIDVLINSYWPDRGQLAGMNRHSLKWRRRHRVASR